MIWDFQAEHPLDVDLEKFSKVHGEKALASAIVHLKEVQGFLRRMRDLDAINNLPRQKAEVIKNLTNQLADFLNRLNVYDQNDPTSTLGVDPPVFLQQTNRLRMEVYSSLHSDLAYLTSLQIKDIKTYESYISELENKAQNMSLRFAELEKKAQENLEGIKKEAEKSVEQQGDREVAKIVGVETTQEWAEEYRQYINDDVSIVNALGAMQDKKRTINKGRHGFWGWIRKCGTNLRFIILRWWIKNLQGSVFYSGHSYANAIKRWRFWRGLYFLALLGAALLYLSYLLLHGLPTRDQWPQFLLEKLAFVPLIVVLSMGFTFAGRNYRINANLLEEYKHRYVVAKTLQNLLRLPEIKNGNGDSSKLLAKATSILFEHKTSGHMGKNSIEDQLIRDLVGYTVKKNKK